MKLNLETASSEDKPMYQWHARVAIPTSGCRSKRVTYRVIASSEEEAVSILIKKLSGRNIFFMRNNKKLISIKQGKKVTKNAAR